MKELFGSPGKLSGLCLRIGQCLFAAASLGVMASASGFSTATAFWSVYCIFFFFLLSFTILGSSAISFFTISLVE